MGDMADMLIEQGYGELADGNDYGYEPRKPSPKTCRHCGKTGLYWALTDSKWRLHDHAGKMHVCKVKPLPAPPKPCVITDPVEKAFRAGYEAGYNAAMDKAYPDVGPGNIGNKDAWKDYKKTL